jgi:hypothetical protein
VIAVVGIDSLCREVDDHLGSDGLHHLPELAWAVHVDFDRDDS